MFVTNAETGFPHVKLLPAMDAEHCTKPGHDYSFTTRNYHITTTPETEWNLIVNGAPIRSDDCKHGRVIRSLDEYMKEATVEAAGLCKEEVISVILYTGPMVSSTKLLRSNVYE